MTRPALQVRFRRISGALLTGALSLGMLSACSMAQPTYVRDTDVHGLDQPAMSTRLDRADLERLMNENMASFTSSRFYARQAASTAEPPTMAILTMENWTTEHIEPQLHALLGMMETRLVQSGVFRVVAANLRDTILDELRLQQGVEFDPARALPLGRQLGVHYFVTGRVVDNSERTESARRVQYFMFMQAISVETGEIVWQNEAHLTKAIIPL